jgi:pantoate--beta-alanine ligase
LAPKIHEVIESAGEALQSGKRNFEELENLATDALSEAGFKVEYVAIRRALDLSVPNRDCDELVVLVAAHLGKARLIDNTVVTI